LSLFTLLVGRYWRTDAADPHWPDRDRLIVSGTAQGPLPEGAMTVEGPPGLAVGVAAGMAIAERLLAARFGRAIVDHRTWLLAQARDLGAGPAQETLAVASALRLGRLAVLAAMPQRDARLLTRFSAAGWMVRTVLAGDERETEGALSAALRSQKPTLIVETGRAEPGWMAAARAAESGAGDGQEPGAAEAAMERGETGTAARRSWLKRLRRHAQREAFGHALTCHYPPGWHRAAYAEDTPPEPSASPEIATKRALSRLTATLPELTTLPFHDGLAIGERLGEAFPAPAQGGAPIWDGLDQAALACAAGMALHGGLLPVLRCAAGQAEFARPVLRLAVQNGARLLQIAAAEDAGGEMPPAPAGAGILTPYDTAEALDCLVLALRQPAGPSILILPPETPPAPPAGHRLCARGGYLVHDVARRDVTLLVAGAGMALAAAVRASLAAQGREAALVSIPSRSLFAVQDANYQEAVLGSAPRVWFGGATRFAGLAGLGDMLVDLDAPEAADRIVRRILAQTRAVPSGAAAAS
jgi:transketolase